MEDWDKIKEELYVDCRQTDEAIDFVIELMKDKYKLPEKK
jgi:hypothetical protein